MSGPGSGDPPDESGRDDETRDDHRPTDASGGTHSSTDADSDRDRSADESKRNEPGGDEDGTPGDTSPDGGESSDPAPGARASAGRDAATANSDRGGERDVRSTVDTPAGAAGPSSETGGTESDGVSIGEDGLIRWFLGTDNGTVVVVRDVASSVGIVLLVGLLLFAVSGIWPPMVAVESGSMEPNMQRGDLVFVVEEERFVGDGAIGGTGVVTRDSAGDGHEKFGQPGDVIVFRPGGSDFRTPVIHRAHFWVEEGENWVATQATDDFLNGASCSQLQTCPAPHDGFVTKGDNNAGYDQAHSGARTTVVRPDWVTGKAMFRIPLLGHVRLTFDAILSTAQVDPTPGAIDPGHAPGLVSATESTTEEPSGAELVVPSSSGAIPNPYHPAVGGGAIVGVTAAILTVGRRRFAS